MRGFIPGRSLEARLLRRPVIPWRKAATPLSRASPTAFLLTTGYGKGHFWDYMTFSKAVLAGWLWRSSSLLVEGVSSRGAGAEGSLWQPMRSQGFSPTTSRNEICQPRQGAGSGSFPSWAPDEMSSLANTSLVPCKTMSGGPSSWAVFQLLTHGNWVVHGCLLGYFQTCKEEKSHIECSCQPKSTHTNKHRNIFWKWWVF